MADKNIIQLTDCGGTVNISPKTDAEAVNVNIGGQDKTLAAAIADGSIGGGTEYTLSAATNIALGGIKADNKTVDMTQEVKIGGDQKLYVAPKLNISEGNNSSNQGSFAFGTNTVASSHHSFAMCDKNVCKGYNSICCACSSQKANDIGNVGSIYPTDDQENHFRASDNILKVWKKGETPFRFALAFGNKGSNAFGYDTLALGHSSHAEGAASVAYGDDSHAEGTKTEAMAWASHAEGVETYCDKKIAVGAHAEGWKTRALGKYSHAAGEGIISHNICETAVGRYNSDTADGETFDQQNYHGAQTSLFTIGVGVNSGNRNTGFKFFGDGHAKALKAWEHGGADYAEMFEWKDGNRNSEKRYGYFVSLEGNKIIKANSKSNIIGVVSVTAGVIGDNPMMWSKKYLTDKWGNVIYEDVEVTDQIMGDGGILKPYKYTVKSPKLNPDYDESQRYIDRADRPEWDAIGLLGKLRVRQDGTLKVGDYCISNDSGIATKSKDDSGYYVMEVIDKECVKILFK